jgi:hypothetical protein
VTGKSKICTVCGSTSLLQLESPAAPPPAKQNDAGRLPLAETPPVRQCAITQPDPFIGGLTQPSQITSSEDAPPRRQLSSLRRKFADCEEVPEQRWDQRLADFGKNMLGR